MTQKKANTKGVSLTLVIGLVALLMVTSAAVNQLIINNLKSIQRIEASNRAYLIAEAGIEDALYELSQHYAGYETPDLGTAEVRSSKLDGTNWYNQWEIESKSRTDHWEGKLYKSQKLVIPLFNDTNNVVSNQVYNFPKAATNPLKQNTINYGSQDSFDNFDIKTLNLLSFKINFILPPGVLKSGGKLLIDNDDDFWANGHNEDGPLDNGSCPSFSPEDSDCDGLVDEDSAEDPVIIWKLTDGGSRSLIPVKGCLDPAEVFSEICETNFSDPGIPGQTATVELNQNHFGVNQDGTVETIASFMQYTYLNFPNTQLHFEFLIVAPMEHIVLVPAPAKKIEIPYFTYTIDSSSPDGTQIPYPFFSIKSDGYYRGFKQSITSLVTPKTTVPLFDFTIIQQE